MLCLSACSKSEDNGKTTSKNVDKTRVQIVLENLGIQEYCDDFNEDGYDDAVFRGVKCLMYDFDELPLASSYIEEVYLYDVDKNEFIYSEEFGYEQELK